VRKNARSLSFSSCYEAWTLRFRTGEKRKDLWDHGGDLRTKESVLCVCSGYREGGPGHGTDFAGNRGKVDETTRIVVGVKKKR